MKIWVIVVWFINATTGDQEREYVSQTPLTIEECNQALIDRGPVPVKDNQAQFAYCKKLEGKVSI